MTRAIPICALCIPTGVGTRAILPQLLWNPLLQKTIPQVLCWPLFQNKRLKVPSESADTPKRGRECTGSVEGQDGTLAPRQLPTGPGRILLRISAMPQSLSHLRIPLSLIPLECVFANSRFANSFRMNVCVTTQGGGACLDTLPSSLVTSSPLPAIVLD